MKQGGWGKTAMVAAAVIMAATGRAWAQDPVEVGPDIYTVLFENERVRVCEARFAPAASIAMHSHPDHFAYVLEAGTLQISYPNGSSTDLAATEGQVLWMSGETHAGVNIGQTPVRLLVVELKEHAAMAHEGH